MLTSRYNFRIIIILVFIRLFLWFIPCHKAPQFFLDFLYAGALGMNQQTNDEWVNEGKGNGRDGKAC